MQHIDSHNLLMSLHNTNIHPYKTIIISIYTLLVLRQKTMVTSQRERNSGRGFNVILLNGIWIMCIQRSSFTMRNAAGGDR